MHVVIFMLGIYIHTFSVHLYENTHKKALVEFFFVLFCRISHKFVENAKCEGIIGGNNIHQLTFFVN